MHTMAADVPPVPEIQATAFLIEDVQSGDILASRGLHDTVEPASLTKLMTAYLAFKAIESGRLSLDQELTVSTKGWRTEGSRMFLDPRVPATVENLLKGLIVQSGNDAAITLAEAIGGSEENFAMLMNQEAVRLGMKDTHFKNSTGLPEAGHVTSVFDMGLLAQAIIRDFPEFYKIYSIKSFTYNNITQMNRNLLLYRDPSVDGLKTGHTSSAGYNLVASSHRNGRRVISVVMGTESAQARATESSKLLNWSLQFFDTPKLFDANQSIAQVRVYKGVENTVAVGFRQPLYITLPAGDAKHIQPILETKQPVIAPIKAGTILGTLKLMNGDRVVATKPVVALSDVEQAGWFSRFWDSIVLWVKSLFN